MFHSMFPLISFYHYTSRHLLTFRFIFWSCTCHSSFSLLLILPSFHSPFFVLPTSSSLSLRSLFRAVRRPRRAAPPTNCGRRRRLLLIGAPPSKICRSAADGILDVYFFSCNFGSMTKKRSSENVEYTFFRESLKNSFWRPTPRRCRRRFFGTGGAPPLTKN